MTSPYLQPVAAIWARIAGYALLVAAVALTAALGYALFDVLVHEDSRRTLNSSSLIFALILLSLCGICWQAGWRLVLRRPGGSGALFSRPAWFAIGAAMLVLTGLMAATILSVRRPTIIDVQVMLFLGGIGVWCVLLALRRQ